MQQRQNFVILPLVQPTEDGSLIDKAKIAQICAQGLSECPPEDRAVAWLVLLSVYPERPEDWSTIQDQRKQLYQMFMEEYNMQDWTKRVFKPNVKKTDFCLSDNDIMSVIHGDVIRTGRQLFFLPYEEIPEGENPNFIQAPFTYHIRRIERILYIFAMTNPTLHYMQGFNELVIPLYYVLIKAKTMFRDDTILIESLVYAMLQYLLTATDIQEFYATKDQSATVINKLNSYEKILEKFLPEIHATLKKLNIYPLLYAYRWFNILFGQEYELPVLLMIWDALFSHVDNIVQFSFYIGVAHLKVVENMIVPDSFPKTVEVLQNLKIPNALTVVKEANIMWNKRKEKKLG
jgi:hypothetical protein